jgi:type II secretory pathway predicted ATPase ExeA
MYLDYYRLAKEPFHITPDPEFLYLSPSHKEALGALMYGTDKRKGFVAVTGEVGTGKTTIIRSYLEQIDKKKVKPIYIFNANVSFEELLKTILEELDISNGGDNAYAMVHRLHMALIEEYKKDFNIVLIIDEAQNMPIGTLENLRMLSNLETSKDKLIQIVMVGQPEFREKLESRELRQLKQRVAFRAEIFPLDKKDSLAYIKHRLELVQLSEDKLFTRVALSRIVDYAKGSPRVLNILCDNALIAGYGYQVKPISARIIKQVITDYEGKKRCNLLWFLKPAAVFCLAAGAFYMAFVHYQVPPLPHWVENIIWQTESVESNVGTQSATNNIKNVEPDNSVALPDEYNIDHASGTLALPNKKLSDATKEIEVIAPIKSVIPDSATDEYKVGLVDKVKSTTNEQVVQDSSVPQQATQVVVVIPEAMLTPPPPAVESMERDDPFVEEIETINAAVKYLLSDKPKQPEIIDEIAEITYGAYPVKRRVKPGDYLSKMCVEVYGVTSYRIIGLIKQHNTQIQDANKIIEGDLIYFPAIDLDVVRGALENDSNL